VLESGCFQWEVVSLCAQVCCQVSNPNYLYSRTKLDTTLHVSCLDVGVGRAAQAYDRSEWHVQQRPSPLQQLATAAPGLGPRLVHLETEPREQQDWILMCPQGGRAHLLTAVGWRHSAALSSKVRVGVGVRVWVRAIRGCLSHHPIASRDTLRDTPAHTEALRTCHGLHFFPFEASPPSAPSGAASHTPPPSIHACPLSTRPPQLAATRRPLLMDSRHAVERG
jgi:hypothetical protein